MSLDKQYLLDSRLSDRFNKLGLSEQMEQAHGCLFVFILCEMHVFCLCATVAPPLIRGFARAQTPPLAQNVYECKSETDICDIQAL